MTDITAAVDSARRADGLTAGAVRVATDRYLPLIMSWSASGVRQTVEVLPDHPQPTSDLATAFAEGWIEQHYVSLAMRLRWPDEHDLREQYGLPREMGH